MSCKDIIAFSDQAAVRKLLLCIRCKNLLNVLPIVFYDNVGYICGRCPSPGISLPGVKQSLYEGLLQLITFPCANEESGCKKILNYNEVILHEKTCTFRRLKCPLSFKPNENSNACSWEGLTNCIQEHLKTHKNYFRDPPQLEFSAYMGNSVFFTYFGVYVATVVIRQQTDKKYNVFIAMDGTEIESQSFKYQVELLNTDKNTSILLRKHRLHSLLDFWENLNNPEAQLELRYENILELLQKPKRLMMKFGIIKKSKEEIFQITGGKDIELFKFTEEQIETKYMPRTDNNLLSALECPSCNEYILPPVYLCAIGHGICSSCKTKIKSCPTCRSKINNNPLHFLDKLISKINYPCRNRNTGCEFVGTSDNVKAHQNKCSFSLSCILCHWKGEFEDFHAHLQTNHKVHILEHNVFHTAKLSDSFITFYCVHNQVFCAIFRPFKLKCQTGLSVSITHIFVNRGNPKFKYEVEISRVYSTDNGNSNDNSFFLSNISCISTLYKDFKVEHLENLDCGIFIPHDLLKIYTDNDRYYYKIFIEKI